MLKLPGTQQSIRKSPGLPSQVGIEKGSDFEKTRVSLKEFATGITTTTTKGTYYGLRPACVT